MDRPSPNVSAMIFPYSTMVGNDGKMWTSLPDINGSYKWRRNKPGEQSLDILNNHISNHAIKMSVAKQSTRRVAKQSTRRVSKKSTRRVAKQSTRRVAKQSTRRVSKKSTRRVSKKSTRRVAKQSTRRVSKKSTRRVAKI